MAKPTKTSEAVPAARTSKRIKCACSSCTCTVNMDRAVRRNNQVFCSETCASHACSHERCGCEHDTCVAQAS